MWYVVWCLRRGEDPRIVLAIHGPVAVFCGPNAERDARAMAKAGHPMHKGRYRVVQG